MSSPRVEVASGKKQFKTTELLDDQLVAAAVKGFREGLGPDIIKLTDQFGVNPEDIVRYMSLAHQLQGAREWAGLSVKEVAAKLGVPQYRVRAAESDCRSVQSDVLQRYVDLVGLRDWYAKWARQNSELAERIAGGQGPTTAVKAAKTPQPDTVAFSGRVVSVKARIRLIRSFDQIWHEYQGYILEIASSEEAGLLVRAAIGPKTHEKHQFRIGDRVSGKGRRFPHPKKEWAELYRVSGLKLEARGPASEERPADPDGGLAPPLTEYRTRGHRRLAARRFETKCARCPFGLKMSTEIILDQWNPDKKQWRLETHCFGPRGCERHKPGPPRRVQGSKPGMVWIDDDVEREESEEPLFAKREHDRAGEGTPRSGRRAN